jgi:aminoglycoside phosphotransferase
MKKVPGTELDEALDWSASVLGQIKVMSDHSKTHGGHESSTCRLLAPAGFCYLKIHESQPNWHNEVHAYEHWSCAFGNYAPKLLAVRDTPPLALIVSELPGQIMEDAQLPVSQERVVWRTAGAALVALHDLGSGEFFGPCLRDGTSAEAFPRDAREYISIRFKDQIENAIQNGYINADELSTIQAAYDLIPAFEGERPLPCHRDYCAANWLISEKQYWSGVIDFEFASWDVRVADFSRDPNWSWIRRPDLVDAFCEGYGRSFTSSEEQQLLVAHAEYAVSAILWGHDNAFYGFEREGRESIAHLATLLK